MGDGLATAAGSFGQFIFAPLGQGFISSYGWQTVLVILAACTILVPVLALFGFVFFSHQVGAFLGVWLGGVSYEMTGSYDLVWWARGGPGPHRRRPAPAHSRAPRTQTARGPGACRVMNGDRE